METLEQRNLLTAWKEAITGTANWADDANWVGENAPAANSNIEISLANANAELTINMPSGAATGMGLITVKTGKVTFNLNGQNFNTFGLWVEGGANGNGAVTIRNSQIDLELFTVNYFTAPTVSVSAGQTLTVTGISAGISAAEVRVGAKERSSNVAATMNVTAHATLSVTQNTEINVGILNVNQGSQLQSPVLKIGGNQAVDGQFNVEDEDSAATVDNLTVASNGNATMAIQNGGHVSAAYMIIADQWQRGSVSVNGSESKLDVSEQLAVGAVGEGSMTIGDGARVESAWTSIGSIEAEGFASVTNGASWSTLYLHVFRGEMLIDDGAEVETIVDASISGYQPSVYVGANCTWTIGLRLEVGSPHSGILTINGENALVQCAIGNLGGESLGVGARMVRILGGGKWKATSEDDFLLGSDDQPCFVEINEGTLEANGNIIPGSKTIVKGKATLASAAEINASDWTKIIAGGEGVLGTTTLDAISASTPMMFLELGDDGESDKISATGDLSVSGTLNVSSLTDSTNYNIGDEFTLVEADGTLSGFFEGLADGMPATPVALVTLPKLRQGLTWMATYDDNEVVLHVVSDIKHLTEAHRLNLTPNASVNIAGEVLIGAGYGYGYGYAGSGTWDLADNPGDFPHQSTALSWISRSAKTFSLSVSGGTATFVVGSETPLTYAYSGDITDLYLRAFLYHYGASVTLDNLTLNGDIPIDDSAFATYVGGAITDILHIPGLGSQFTSISGNVTIDFDSAGFYPASPDMGFQILLGTSEDLSPVTVDSSIDTAGHVTLNWDNISTNTTSIQILRSDDGGENYTTLDTITNLAYTSFTDTTGSYVNSIYVVNQSEFSWLDVPTTVIPTAGPTLTVNLNSSGDLAGVKFVLDEEDASLMDILVDDVVTAQVNWGRIGELIINGTADDDDVTLDGALNVAATIHGDDGEDSITLSGGNWGEWGAPLTIDTENSYNLDIEDGAWVHFDSAQELGDLTIGEDSAAFCELAGEDAVSVDGEFTLAENGALDVESGTFSINDEYAMEVDSAIYIGDGAQLAINAGVWNYDTYADIDVAEGGVLSISGDVRSQGVITLEGTLDVASGQSFHVENLLNFFDGAAIDAAEATFYNAGTIHWYTSDISLLATLPAGTLYFEMDVDLTGAALDSGDFHIADGVTATITDDTDVACIHLTIDAGAALFVSGGTLALGGEAGGTTVQVNGLLDIAGADVTTSYYNYFCGSGDIELTDGTLTIGGTGNELNLSGYVFNINDGGILDIVSNYSNDGTLNVNAGGTLLVESTGSFNLNGDGWAETDGVNIYDGGVVQVEGNFNDYGKLNVYAGGSFTIDSGGDFIIFYAVNIETGGTFTNDGAIHLFSSDVGLLEGIGDEGTIVFENSCDISSLTLGSGQTFRIANYATVTLSSNWTSHGTLIVDSSATLAAGAYVTLTNYGEIDLPTGHNDSFIANAGSGFVVFV